MQSIPFGNLDMMLILPGLKKLSYQSWSNQKANCEKTYLSDSTYPCNLNEKYDCNGFGWRHQQLFGSQDKVECISNNRSLMPFAKIFRKTKFLNWNFWNSLLYQFENLSMNQFEFMLCWSYGKLVMVDLQRKYSALDFSSAQVFSSRHAKSIRLNKANKIIFHP